MTRLRKLRIGYGYEQKYLAEKVGVSTTHMCNLEKGDRLPSPVLAKRIASVFGAKVEAVFPDGVAEKVCLDRFAPPVPLPPEAADSPMLPLIDVPDGIIATICPHCHTLNHLRYYGPARYETAQCPACACDYTLKDGREVTPRPTSLSKPLRHAPWHKGLGEGVRA